VATNIYPDPGFESGALNTEYQFTGASIVDSTKVVQRGVAEWKYENLVRNPSAEVNTTDWATSGTATQTTFARETGWSSQGAASFRLTSNHTGAGQFRVAGHSSSGPPGLFPAVAGRTYAGRMAGNVLALPAGASVGVKFDWYDAAGVYMSSTGTTAAKTTTGTYEVIHTGVAPASVGYGSFSVVHANTAATGSVDSYFDGALVVEGMSVPPPYFDGASAGCYWRGAAHASKSVLTEQPVTLSGDYSLRLSSRSNANASTSFTVGSIGWHLPASEGELWRASALAGYATHPSLLGRLSLIFRDAAKANVSGGPNPSDATTSGVQSPRRLSVSATAPTGTAYCLVYMNLVLQGTAGVIGAVTFDEVMVTVDEELPPRWFSGDSPGAQWTGARYRSVELGDGDSLEEMKDWVPPYYFSEVVA
jgi:hypothetical protein